MTICGIIHVAIFKFAKKRELKSILTGKDITDELVQLSSSVSNRNKRAVDSPWEGLAGVDTSYDPQVSTIPFPGQ